MMWKLSIGLVLALVGGALVVGCGSGAGTPSRTQTIPAATSTGPTATKATTTGRVTGTGGTTGNTTSSRQTTPTPAKTTSTGTAPAIGPTPGQIGQRSKELSKQTAKACMQAVGERTLPAAQRTALEKLCKRLH
jgi:hypothetical protein